MSKIKNIFVIFFIFISHTAFADYPQQSLAVDGGHIKYYQIGQGQPVLLLHGLFADKEQWLPLVAKLDTANHQFIIPDLAGYGNSKGYPIETYVLDSTDPAALTQVRVLHDFIQALKLDAPFDIAGNSMGGLIMALYAHHYPDEVSSMAFIGSPGGVGDYTERFYDTGFRHCYNPFIPTTAEQFKAELQLLLVNYQAIMPSDEIIEKIVQNTQKNYQHLTAAFNVLSIKQYRQYLTKTQSATQPVLVLWGDQDYIFGSTKRAKKLCQKYQTCGWHAIQNAGHLLLLENDEALTSAAKYYQAFLKR